MRSPPPTGNSVSPNHDRSQHRTDPLLISKDEKQGCFCVAKFAPRSQDEALSRNTLESDGGTTGTESRSVNPEQWKKLPSFSSDQNQNRPTTPVADISNKTEHRHPEIKRSEGSITALPFTEYRYRNECYIENFNSETFTKQTILPSVPSEEQSSLLSIHNFSSIVPHSLNPEIPTSKSEHILQRKLDLQERVVDAPDTYHQANKAEQLKPPKKMMLHKDVESKEILAHDVHFEASHQHLLPNLSPAVSLSVNECDRYAPPTQSSHHQSIDQKNLKKNNTSISITASIKKRDHKMSKHLNSQQHLKQDHNSYEDQPKHKFYKQSELKDESCPSSVWNTQPVPHKQQRSIENDLLTQPIAQAQDKLKKVSNHKQLLDLGKQKEDASLQPRNVVPLTSFYQDSFMYGSTNACGPSSTQYPIVLQQHHDPSLHCAKPTECSTHSFFLSAPRNTSSAAGVDGYNYHPVSDVHNPNHHPSLFPLKSPDPCQLLYQLQSKVSSSNDTDDMTAVHVQKEQIATTGRHETFHNQKITSQKNNNQHEEHDGFSLDFFKRNDDDCENEQEVIKSVYINSSPMANEDIHSACPNEVNIPPKRKVKQNAKALRNKSCSLKKRRPGRPPTKSKRNNIIDSLSLSPEDRIEALKSGVRKFKNPSGKIHDDQVRRILLRATLAILQNEENLSTSGAIKQVSSLACVSHMTIQKWYQRWEEDGCLFTVEDEKYRKRGFEMMEDSSAYRVVGHPTYPNRSPLQAMELLSTTTPSSSASSSNDAARSHHNSLLNHPSTINEINRQPAQSKSSLSLNTEGVRTQKTSLLLSPGFDSTSPLVPPLSHTSSLQNGTSIETRIYPSMQAFENVSHMNALQAEQTSSQSNLASQNMAQNDHLPAIDSSEILYPSSDANKNCNP